MLRLLLLVCLALSLAFDLSAQADVRKLDPRESMMDFVPGQVLLQVVDGQQVGLPANGRLSSVSSVDKVLLGYKVKSVKRVFEGAEDRSGKVEYRTNAVTGEQIKMPNLAKVLKVELEGEGMELRSNTMKLVEELKKDKSIVFAEPNYIYQTLIREDRGLVEVPKAAKLNPLAKALYSSSNIKNTNAITPDDPLYSQQQGIVTHNIDKVWNATGTGDGTSIIAIIDTGVDYTHPDLAPNIWSNTKEAGKAEGHDDDNNGYADDIRGWDFINNDSDPMDDNLHGTHVAGIAAAVGGNGIGMAGVNWKAKIMPLKALQSSGRGDAATISEAIRYAYKNGATVINMSFGSYAESQVMKLALSEAYASAVLVAAAGNDGVKIGPCLGCAPMFPAAFQFVLGVQENAAGSIGSFSNFDQDGPVFSHYPDLWNYEAKAAGAGIVSAVPGGQYRSLSGTSMAAPLVAGAVSLYKEQHKEESKELLFGNIINTSSGGRLDLQAMLNSTPSPRLDFVTYRLRDNIDGDNDQRPDANETIEIFYKVKNTWAQANKVFVSIEMGEFEDKSIVSILTPQTEFGSISAYAVRETAVPLKVKISPGVADGRDIVFTARIWYVDMDGNKQGERQQKLILTVENGVELKGIISQNMTLTPDKYYIVTDHLFIANGYILTLKPGTKLRMKDKVGISISGELIANGTPDSLIYFTKAENGQEWAGFTSNTTTKGLECNYCVIEYFVTKHNGSNYDHLIKGKANIKNSILRYNLFYSLGTNDHLSIDKSTIIDNKYAELFQFHVNNNNITIFNNNYVGNNKGWYFGYKPYGSRLVDPKIIGFNNNALLDDYALSSFTWGNPEIYKIEPNYFGSIKEETIRKRVLDFFHEPTRPPIDLSNRQLIPSPEVHGFVWKVLVNGLDAQDEYEQLDALGVAKHKVDVYFNRPMDKAFVPYVSMGVREPYTQTAISTDGSWNTEGTIYTTYLQVGVSTGDGINRIRVANARDLEHFEIPVEDQRFNVLVNAAGALSTGFAATPGLGKVQLEWAEPTAEEVSDLLGYEMYRYTVSTDPNTGQQVESEPKIVNKVLISSSTGTPTYTDFAVVPGQQYFYKYKIIRTNMTESDFSSAVAATPLTASKGDSNGDLKVSVMDVQTTVAHILGQAPQPFIFEAADVNSDTRISVVDVVGTVNLVLTSGARLGVGGITPSTAPKPEMSFIKVNSKGQYELETKERLAAMEFSFSCVKAKDMVWPQAWSGYEKAFRSKGDTTFVMVYSMNGKTMETGKVNLFSLPKEARLLGLTLVSAAAQEMPYKLTVEQAVKAEKEQALAYPNPFEQLVNLKVVLEQDARQVEVILVNMQGQVTERIRTGSAKTGPHTLEVRPRARGMLLYTVLADGQVIANGKIIKQ